MTSARSNEPPKEEPQAKPADIVTQQKLDSISSRAYALYTTTKHGENIIPPKPRVGTEKIEFPFYTLKIHPDKESEKPVNFNADYVYGMINKNDSSFDSNRTQEKEKLINRLLCADSAGFMIPPTEKEWKEAGFTTQENTAIFECINTAKIAETQYSNGISDDPEENQEIAAGTMEQQVIAVHKDKMAKHGTYAGLDKDHKPIHLELDPKKFKEGRYKGHKNPERDGTHYLDIMGKVNALGNDTLRSLSYSKTGSVISLPLWGLKCVYSTGVALLTIGLSPIAALANVGSKLACFARNTTFEIDKDRNISWPSAKFFYKTKQVKEFFDLFIKANPGASPIYLTLKASCDEKYLARMAKEAKARGIVLKLSTSCEKDLEGDKKLEKFRSILETTREPRALKDKEVELGESENTYNKETVLKLKRRPDTSKKTP